MPNKAQEEIHQNIISDYISGMKIIDISKKYQKPSSNLIQMLQNRGVYVSSTNRWTSEEIDYLENNYSSTDWNEIISKLHRHKKDDIIHKAYKLKLSRDVYFWSDADIEILRNGFEHNISNKKIANLLGNRYNTESINTKAHKLGLRKREKWSKSEVSLLKEIYQNTPIQDVLIRFPKRNIDTVIQKANSLGLVSYEYKKRLWTPIEDKYIVDNWESMSDRELSDNLDRTFRATKARRERLGFVRYVSPGKYNYLDEYIRKRNKEWKQLSAANCNYQCVISGKKFDDIHHLYGENLIIQESLDALELDMKDVYDYSEKELQAILNEFLKRQSTYPLGVCLTHEIHKEFHNQYGYGNNTPFQFDEFYKSCNI